MMKKRAVNFFNPREHWAFGAFAIIAAMGACLFAGAYPGAIIAVCFAPFFTIRVYRKQGYQDSANCAAVLFIGMTLVFDIAVIFKFWSG